MLKGGKMHEQHSLVRILAQQRRADKQLRSIRLSDAGFPNGKIWYQYMWMSSKKSAYVRLPTSHRRSAEPSPAPLPSAAAKPPVRLYAPSVSPSTLPVLAAR